MDNLSLWNAVAETDPAYTKKAKKGAYHFTSIAPMYQFKKATAVFGPQGIGWGIAAGSESFEEKEYGTTILLSYDAVLFYLYNGDRGEIPIHATEKICYQTQGANGYLKIDDESRKKVVTNAKTKGLSEIGLCADVFMGMFDDQNYVEDAGNKALLEKADNRLEEEARQEAEYQEWLSGHLKTLSSAASMNELQVVYKLCVRKAKTRCDESAVIQFTKAKDKRKGELSNG